MGARSAGNPHAACDVEGTGNVARSSGLPARQSSTLPMSGMWKRSHGGTSEAPPDKRGGNRYVLPNATAPHLYSTKSDVKLVTRDVCIALESRDHRSLFILRVEYIPQAVDHLAVLRDRHLDGGPDLSVGELDGLRHGRDIRRRDPTSRSASRCRPYAGLVGACRASSPQIYG
jgi:hypothetical protein